MQYNIIVSDKAKKCIGQHIKYLSQININAAKQLKKNIINDIKSLSDMPQRHGFLDGDFIPSNKYHKMISNKRYLILYQIKDDNVYIDLVIDCRQDYQWLIK